MDKKKLQHKKATLYLRCTASRWHPRTSGQTQCPGTHGLFLTGNQRRAAAKERIKDDAIGHGRVSDRILAEIEDNHMRERDTKIGLAEQRQVAFLEIAFQILPLKSKQKRAP